MNRESSRSHSVLTLHIEAQVRARVLMWRACTHAFAVQETHPGGLTKSRTARFHLIDLAGSERQKVCGAPNRRAPRGPARAATQSRARSPRAPLGPR